MDYKAFLEKEIQARKDFIYNFNDKLARIEELKKEIQELEAEVGNADCVAYQDEIDTLNGILNELYPAEVQEAEAVQEQLFEEEGN